MGNRFWEFYLVRYLLGTIFAIIILFYLFYNYNNEISRSFFSSQESPQNAQLTVSSFLFDTSYTLTEGKPNQIVQFIKSILEPIGIENYSIQNNDQTLDINFEQSGISILTMIIIIVAGFFYMYLSSMLILVMHGLRSVLFGFDKKIIWKNSMNELKIKIQNNFDETFFLIEKIILIIEKPKRTIIFILLFLFILFIGSILIVSQLYKHFLSITILMLAVHLFKLVYLENQKFYISLAEYRSKKRNIEQEERNKAEKKNSEIEINQHKEYIESYKHLREHGNAFGIIICEILLAGWLIFWDFSFWAIVYWSLMGFSSWILGTYLEVKAVERFEVEKEKVGGKPIIEQEKV